MFRKICFTVKQYVQQCIMIQKSQILVSLCASGLNYCYSVRMITTVNKVAASREILLFSLHIRTLSLHPKSEI